MPPNFAGLPVHWLPEAVITIGEDGMPVATPGRAAASRLPPVGADEFVAVLRDVHGIGHYFHFMEKLITLHALHLDALAHLRLARIHVGRQAWNNMRQHGLQLELLRILYAGGWVVENFDGAIGERNVLLIDADDIITTINRFLQPLVTIAARHLPQMRRQVFDACAIAPRRAASPMRVLYIHRTHARSLDPTLRERLMRWLAERDYAVTTVDYAEIAWREQVRATHAADVVIGAHGNGLTNALWAAPHAAVIELFPDGCHDYAYQLLCEIARISYLGLQGVAAHGFVTREHCRMGPPGGTPTGNVTALPWESLGMFLDAHRAAAHRP